MGILNPIKEVITSLFGGDNNQVVEERRWKIDTTSPKGAPNGRVVCQLVALKDFGDVKAGDRGGYIDDDVTMDQTGTCWVYPGSIVSGYVRIRDNVKIIESTIYTHNQWSSIHLFNDVKIEKSVLIITKKDDCGRMIIADNVCVHESRIEGNVELHGRIRVMCNSLISSNKGDIIKYKYADIFKQAPANYENNLVPKKEETPKSHTATGYSSAIQFEKGIHININKEGIISNSIIKNHVFIDSDECSIINSYILHDVKVMAPCILNSSKLGGNVVITPETFMFDFDIPFIISKELISSYRTMSFVFIANPGLPITILMFTCDITSLTPEPVITMFTIEELDEYIKEYGNERIISLFDMYIYTFQKFVTLSPKEINTKPLKPEENISVDLTDDICDRFQPGKKIRR